MAAVGEVAAVIERHAHDGVARLQHCEVGGHVGLAPRVRLDVGEVGGEQLLGAIDGELLELVGELAPFVVPAPRISLGVLVGEHRTARLHDGPGGEVLRRDELDAGLLACELRLDELGDDGIDVGYGTRVGHVMGSFDGARLVPCALSSPREPRAIARRSASTRRYTPAARRGRRRGCVRW